MFSHKIDKIQGIIFTRVSGTPTTVSIIDHVQKVMNNPDFDPGYNSLIVLEENTTIIAIPKNKISTLRSVLDGYAQQRKGRNCAIVTPNQRLKAFLKINFEIIGPIMFNFRIFQSEHDALHWLKGMEKANLCI